MCDDPISFARVAPSDDASHKQKHPLDYCSWIGISKLPPERQPTFARLYPHDFVVQEVWSDGLMSTIKPEHSSIPTSSPQNHFLACELIKESLSTYQAAQLLARALGIPEGRIGYSGEKDRSALTSQRITICRPPLGKLRTLRIPGISLKCFHWTTDPIVRGQHRANYFSILLRTCGHPKKVPVISSVSKLSAHGYLNYYGPQRFGSRLSSHVFGRELLRGRFEDTLIQFLTYSDAWDTTVSAPARHAALKLLGDWQQMRSLFAAQPQRFEHELTALYHLAQNPNDPIGALTSISRQVRFWAIAYGSFLFNRLLAGC